MLEILIGHLRWVICLLLLCGTLSAWLVYRRCRSLFWSSVAFTLFCSFGFAVDRLAVPVPTLILVPMMVVEASKPAPPCVPSSEGCWPADTGDAIILVPLLVQWFFWFLMFCLFKAVFKDKKKRRTS